MRHYKLNELLQNETEIKNQFTYDCFKIEHLIDGDRYHIFQNATKITNLICVLSMLNKTLKKLNNEEIKFDAMYDLLKNILQNKPLTKSEIKAVCDVLKQAMIKADSFIHFVFIDLFLPYEVIMFFHGVPLIKRYEWSQIEKSNIEAAEDVYDLHSEYVESKTNFDDYYNKANCMVKELMELNVKQ